MYSCTFGGGGGILLAWKHVDTVCIWHCGHARFCVEVFMHHLWIFSHSYECVHEDYLGVFQPEPDARAVVLEIEVRLDPVDGLLFLCENMKMHKTPFSVGTWRCTKHLSLWEHEDAQNTFLCGNMKMHKTPFSVGTWRCTKHLSLWEHEDAQNTFYYSVTVKATQHIQMSSVRKSPEHKKQLLCRTVWTKGWIHPPSEVKNGQTERI